jgi:hypothetical protein
MSGKTDQVVNVKGTANQTTPAAQTTTDKIFGGTEYDKSYLSEHNIYKTTADLEYGVFEDYSSAVSTLPGSLFYEAQHSQDGRSGLFNYYVISDSTKSLDGKEKFNYLFSEKYEHNQIVTPDVARNPTAHAIIRETTESGAYLKPDSTYVSQPYNVKDFIFCKDYGVIPNNRMITLRRFPTPIMDNLRVPTRGPRIEARSSGGKLQAYEKQLVDPITKQQMIQAGAALPVAQAVTYFGAGTENDLSTILGVSNGLKWESKVQGKQLEANGNDPGIMGTNYAKFLEVMIGPELSKDLTAISNLAGIYTDPDNVQLKINRQLFDKMTAAGGPLSNRLFVDVNTVSEMQVRGQGFTGGTAEFTLAFKYNLTSVGMVNSRMLFIDLFANLLSIGTDYGTFLAPQLLVNSQKQGLGFPGGADNYVKSILDPVGFINDLLKIKFSEEMKAKIESLSGDVQKTKDELSGLAKGVPINKDGKLYKTISAAMTSGLLSKLYYEPVMLSGYPTGEWHIVVGNPLNPIAMIGNLVCTGVSIKFNDVLGPDDFPTEMTAKYTMKPARQRHRGDFESIFNKGNGRLYLGKIQRTDQARNTYVGAVSNTDAITRDVSAKGIPKTTENTATYK